MKTQSSRFDLLMSQEEKGTEDNLGEDVEDTVEDTFGIGSDDVSTFGETPGDGIQQPEEGL